MNWDWPFIKGLIKLAIGLGLGFVILTNVSECARLDNNTREANVAEQAKAESALNLVRSDYDTLVATCAYYVGKNNEPMTNLQACSINKAEFIKERP